MIINERRFLIESPEIFLGSDLIRVTVGDVGRQAAATTGAGFRSVIPRSFWRINPAADPSLENFRWKKSPIN